MTGPVPPTSTDERSALASFPQEVVMQPQRQGAFGGVGEGLQRVSLSAGDSDSEDDGSGFSGAGWSSGSRAHASQINRPRKSLTYVAWK